MAPPLIQLRDVALTFGGTPLLAGAELTVSAGERVCLVGRNGSGKSTLLRMAAGLIEPDRGTRFLQPGATLRYLPQEPDLAGAATTLAYVEAGLGPGDDGHQARYLLEQLGLDGSEDPARLSGGEARRAALARVLAPAPDILLLDEPTNHLDLPTIEWLERELPRAAPHWSRSATTVDPATCRRARSGSTVARRAASSALRFLRSLAGRGAGRGEREARSAARSSPRNITRYGVTGRRKATFAGSATCMPCGSPPHPPRRGREGHVAAAAADRSSTLVVEADHIGKPTRNGRSPISHPHPCGDRIGIIGPNGSGKTTLIIY
jgi:ATP-binding cassette subfamily F protein uup